MENDSRGSWTGHVGFILAAAGSAIGLGNIWMFPYRTGVNGGAAFVLVYLAAVALVGVPLLIAEVLVGRSAKRNPVGAFRVLRPGSKWPLVGWLGVASGFLILSYYGVVAGWAVEYSWRSLTGGLADLDAAGVDKAFSALVADGWRQVFWQALFMLATIVVVSRGIEAGIERASKVMMPLLFALILVLLGYAITSPGAGQGLRFLLQPRFGELGWGGVLQALGQAFFSLSLGMGAMITYGSYLEPDKRIARSAFLIAGMDTLLAVLAGLVIFPLVFSFGLEPGAGPGLIFITLPKAFLMMPASSVFASVFFVLVVFAALTSAISLLEVVVSFAVDEYGVGRGPASWAAGIAIFLLGVPSAVFSGFLDRVDGLASNWMLPVGGLFIALFAGWALTRKEVADGYAGTAPASRGFGAWFACIRFVVPVAVGIILLQNTGWFR
ncbi:MAG: sodium-dependent transporter [Deltaproteobacteria bacterium]|nr:MAG: sodium-dependent transporter [Deltaproteobacteria bacterium]